jgi:hypothetical protein
MALPKVYYTRRNSDSHKGMIFMEDLSGRGSCVDVFSSLTAQQCVNVAKEVARLQADYTFMPKTQQSIISDEECVHTAQYKQHFLDEFLSKIGNYGQGLLELPTITRISFRFCQSARKTSTFCKHKIREICLN